MRRIHNSKVYEEHLHDDNHAEDDYKYHSKKEYMKSPKSSRKHARVIKSTPTLTFILKNTISLLNKAFMVDRE